MARGWCGCTHVACQNWKWEKGSTVGINAFRTDKSCRPKLKVLPLAAAKCDWEAVLGRIVQVDDTTQHFAVLGSTSVDACAKNLKV